MSAAICLRIEEGHGTPGASGGGDEGRGGERDQGWRWDKGGKALRGCCAPGRLAVSIHVSPPPPPHKRSTKEPRPPPRGAPPRRRPRTGGGGWQAHAEGQCQPPTAPSQAPHRPLAPPAAPGDAGAAPAARAPGGGPNARHTPPPPACHPRSCACGTASRVVPRPRTRCPCADLCFERGVGGPGHGQPPARPPAMVPGDYRGPRPSRGHDAGGVLPSAAGGACGPPAACPMSLPLHPLPPQAAATALFKGVVGGGVQPPPTPPPPVVRSFQRRHRHRRKIFGRNSYACSHFSLRFLCSVATKSLWLRPWHEPRVSAWDRHCRRVRGPALIFRPLLTTTFHFPGNLN